MVLIIFTTNFYPYNFNGVATYVSDLVDCIINENDIEKVFVITINYNNKVEDIEIKNSKLTIYRCKYNNKFELTDDDKNYILNILEKYPESIKHFHSRELFCWIEKLNIKDYFVTVHNCVYNDLMVDSNKKENLYDNNIFYEYSLFKKRDFLLKNYLDVELETYKNAKMIIAVSNYIKELIVKYYKICESKVITIHNFINLLKLNKINELFDNKNFFRKKFADDNEKILLFSGRVVYEKGVSFLLKAFNIINKEITNIRLIIAGRCEFFHMFFKNYKYYKNITLTGLISFENIYKLYCISDFGIVPSIVEPFGLVSIEMQYFGLPSVISYIDGLKDTFIDGKTAISLNVNSYEFEGITIRKIDPNLIVEKLLFLYKNKEYCDEIKKNAQNFIKNKFSYENHIKLLKYIWNIKN